MTAAAIFVDTSALLPLLDADAEGHDGVRVSWSEAVNDDQPLVTSSAVLVECFALVQSRLGLDAVRVLSQDVVPLFEIEWVDSGLYHSAIASLLTASRRNLSLVDCMSFEVMRRRGISRVLALDADFAEQGFELVPPRTPRGGQKRKRSR
jgi:predicted nucleic acid-binding protein